MLVGALQPLVGGWVCVWKNASLLPVAGRVWKREKCRFTLVFSALRFGEGWGARGRVLGCRAQSRRAGKSLLPNCKAAGIGKSCRLGPCLRRAAAVGLFGNRQLKSVTNAGRDWKKPKRQIGILVTQVNCNDLFAPLLFITPLD